MSGGPEKDARYQAAISRHDHQKPQEIFHVRSSGGRKSLYHFYLLPLEYNEWLNRVMAAKCLIDFD